MKLASELKEGDMIVSSPFSGVEYTQPSEEIILSLYDVEIYLDKLGITNKGNAKIQILNHIKQLNLLPLRYNSPQLPTLIKIMGHIFGDGVLTFIKNRTGFVHFYGNEEDLMTIKSDLSNIGIKTQKIFKRKRHHKIKTQYDIVEFDFEEESIIKKSTGFAILLAALGTPVGKKVHTVYYLPEWLKKSELWQKRLFLASLFGAELSKPKTLNKYNFYEPQYNMNKSEKIFENGISFLNELRTMLSEFEIESNDPVFVYGNDYEGKFGKTRGLRFLIKSNIENLIKLYSLIGYEYQIKKQKLSCLTVDYLKFKQKSLEPNQNNEYRLTDGTILIKRRVNSKFISFEDFIRKNSFGEYGLTLDKIEIIKKEIYSGYVYDFTINHEDHNFIANNFVVSNCGMRLLTTSLTYKDVKPKLKELVDTLFKRVPAGVGSEGFVKLTKQQFKEVIEQGGKWCVKNGYGWKEDLEFTESDGCMPGADSNKVSNKAIERGLNQIGTLGSGNHYLEIQRVKDENIFDKTVAKKLGLFNDQIVIMFHCGSRGFGHQVATDYLRVFLDVMESKYKIKILDRELACAPFNSPEGQDYFSAMKCGINMSFANRQTILHRIREVFSKTFNQSAESLEMHQIYDVAHNTAKLEDHIVDGKIKQLLIHRKGSTRSFPPGHKELPKKYEEIGQPVILGGSMETGSYLLTGMKEGSSTFFSTAHGSGRTMSRMKAKKLWNGQELQKDMEKRGIYVRTTSFSGLAEEAGGAYKQVDEVCEIVEKAGISKRILKFIPIGNVKG